MNRDFSDYIVFADESGDHHLEKIDKRYPVFCLALCIFKKSHYIKYVVPQIQQLKFDFWGHDKIIFHEREMRQQEGDFAFLRTDHILREKFFQRIDEIMKNSEFWITSAVIKKEELKEKYLEPFNPYHIALKICMEKLLSILREEQQIGKKIFCIFEKRGKKEDKQLELEFYRIVNNNNDWGYKRPDFSKIDFDIKFASKQHNSTGLQFADMVARPIGLKILRENQENRPWDIIKEKYYNGYYNKSFP